MRILTFGFLLTWLLLATMACRSDEIPWHTHETSHKHGGSEQNLVLGNPLLVGMKDADVSSSGAILVVNQEGELWLTMLICYIPMSGKLPLAYTTQSVFGCDEGFEGEYIQYKLADFPTLIDGR